jgi:2,4-dienoyl-CoA reductase-like NADH-dependent reductase (Old Yellow Enzyme family)
MNLFDSLKIGALELSNRVIMSPLTRCRAIQNRTPNALMQEYYTQRSSAGLFLLRLLLLVQWELVIQILQAFGQMSK